MKKSSLTYANVVSSIALFVALGGTSYAVARNSIGSAQLKRNAVTSVKVKDQSLQRNDLSPTARIGSRGPRGPRGLDGPAGPPGTLAAGALAPEAWQPLSLIGGWKNYGVYEEGAFRKDKQGQVHLRGLVSQGAGLPSQSLIIAVLPVGYRPLRRQIFTSNGGNPDAYTRIDILADGAITWVVGPNAETDFTTLSGISFWPD